MLYRKIGQLEVPVIGLGTYGLEKNSLENMIRAAIVGGVTYIDSAYRYENEIFIGDTIRKFGIARKDILIGTKLSYFQQISKSAHKAVDESLKNLNTDYIDLYFIHSTKSNTYCSDWKLLQSLKSEGKILELGVSNFNQIHIEELYNATEIYPSINQIEVNIGHFPKDIISFCHEKGIFVQASSPLKRMDPHIINHIDMCHLKEKYSKSFPQIALRWLLQHELLSIPMTHNMLHLVENCNIFDFEIEENDMEFLDCLK